MHIPYLEGVGEASVFCGSIIGACIGFLWFNAPPAKIFMGDTGSLSSWRFLGAVGIITKHEIVLAITGGLFVLGEAVSVIVQVISFKLTGKRIFKMAPIHHHFEKKGWPESTVVVRFWIISIILAMIGLATQIKVMQELKNKFKKKIILIYGYGKSGSASFNYLKNNKIYIFDDFKIIKNLTFLLN